MPIESLAGTAWRLTALGGAGIVAGQPLTLEFSEDGRIFGFAGCNRFTSSCTVEDDSISIGPAASTRMACMPETLMNQEQDYLAALEAASSYALEDGQLTITYGDGQQMVFAAP